MTTYKLLRNLALVFLCFTTMACPNQNDMIDSLREEEILNDPKTVFYLALGDSYTIGEDVAVSERWPNQLSEKLEAHNFLVESKDIIARTGWTTNDLLTAIDQANLDNYNLVSLLIGVNNQYQNQAFSIFETEFDLLLNKAITIAGNIEKVFVVSIPDYGVTPFGSNNSIQIAQEIDQYNNYMSKKCVDLNIPFINITEISRELGNSQGALASDNLHPSGSQYTAWVDEITPVVLGLLAQ